MQRVTGDMAAGATSHLVVELGGNAQGSGYDHLNLTGSLAASGTLDVRLISNYTPGDNFSFNVVSASGGIAM